MATPANNPFGAPLSQQNTTVDNPFAAVTFAPSQQLRGGQPGSVFGAAPSANAPASSSRPSFAGAAGGSGAETAFGAAFGPPIQPPAALAQDSIFTAPPRPASASTSTSTSLSRPPSSTVFSQKPQQNPFQPISQNAAQILPSNPFLAVPSQTATTTTTTTRVTTTAAAAAVAAANPFGKPALGAQGGFGQAFGTNPGTGSALALGGSAQQTPAFGAQSLLSQPGGRSRDPTPGDTSDSDGMSGRRGRANKRESNGSRHQQRPVPNGKLGSQRVPTSYGGYSVAIKERILGHLSKKTTADRRHGFVQARTADHGQAATGASVASRDPYGPCMLDSAKMAARLARFRGPQLAAKPANGSSLGTPSEQIVVGNNGMVAHRQPTERTKQLSEFAYNWAHKLYNQLRKEHVAPPKWPDAVGDPRSRSAVDNLKTAYKRYRERVYASWRNADLIDDPEKRRKLEDALPFKGICEEMCPEFEQIARIAEFDVMSEEKQARADGEVRVAEPALMVKKFGRSAAGQDAPLPTDVRTVDALVRTTDYLFKTLLKEEDNLPSMHNFLWDRTRAVRKDFTFHSEKTDREMLELVKVFQLHTRFHATALHLLSRKGWANEDFDQKQEIEQLANTMQSLIEAYDLCRERDIVCENEPEFRAYYILLNSPFNPTIVKRVQTWGKEWWFQTAEVQTALALVQSFEDVRENKGPIKNKKISSLADTGFSKFFSLVEDRAVSYTMACISEIHFTAVRHGVLKNLVAALGRRRDWPRFITASELNRMLRFDTTEEAVDFANLHDFEFTTEVPEGREPVSDPYLLLNNRRQYVPHPRVRQSSSALLVERKRSEHQGIVDAIYSTIYEEAGKEPSVRERQSSSCSDELFVSQATPAEDTRHATTQDASKPTTELPAFTPQSTTISSFNRVASSTTPATITPLEPKPGKEPMPTTSFSPVLNGLTPSAAGTPSLVLDQPAGDAPEIPASNLPKVFQDGQNPFTKLNQAYAQPPADKVGLVQTTSPAFTTATSPPPAAPSPSFQGSISSASVSTPHATALSTSKTPQFSLSSFGSSAAAAKTSLPTPRLKPSPFGSSNQSTRSSDASKLGVSPFGAPAAATPPSGLTTTASDPRPPVQSAPQSTSIPASPCPRVTFPPATSSPLATAAPSNCLRPSSVLAASQPLLLQPPSLLNQSQTQAPPSQQATPPTFDHLLSKFTSWYVKGDGGVAEEFTRYLVYEICFDVFQQYQKEQTDLQNREEDEQSWTEALAYRHSFLGKKYLHRWQRIARQLAMRRLLRTGKQKMREYREQQRVVKLEAEKARRKAAEKQHRELEMNGRFLTSMIDPARRRSLEDHHQAARQRKRDIEESLLATGVLSGLSDQQAAAQAIVQEGNLRANINGESSQENFPLVNSKGFPAMSATSSDDGSSAPARREGYKTRMLREQLRMPPPAFRGRASSIGSASSYGRTSNFRHSLPSGIAHTNGTSASSLSRSTNFRKRSAEVPSHDGRSPKRLNGDAVASSNELGRGGSSSQEGSYPTRRSGFKTRHMELRAMGFVLMPDGRWLPEAIAKPMQDGKRFDGIGNCGMGPSSPTADPSTAAREGEWEGEALGRSRHEQQERERDGPSSRLQLYLARLKKSSRLAGGSASSVGGGEGDTNGDGGSDEGAMSEERHVNSRPQLPMPSASSAKTRYGAAAAGGASSLSSPSPMVIDGESDQDYMVRGKRKRGGTAAMGEAEDDSDYIGGGGGRNERRREQRGHTSGLGLDPEVLRVLREAREVQELADRKDAEHQRWLQEMGWAGSLQQ